MPKIFHSPQFKSFQLNFDAEHYLQQEFKNSVSIQYPKPQYNIKKTKIIVQSALIAVLFPPFITASLVNGYKTLYKNHNAQAQAFKEIGITMAEKRLNPAATYTATLALAILFGLYRLFYAQYNK